MGCIIKKLRYNFALVFIAFLVYLFTLSKGLNVFDAPEHAKELSAFIDDFDAYHLMNTQAARGPLYIALTLPLFYVSKFFNISIEFLLNFFSLFPTLIASVFVYKTAKIFLKEKFAFFAALLFIFTPLIWFNSIIADRYSLITCMNSIWLYLLISGLRKKDDKKLLVSSVFLLLSIFSHVLSTPLVFIQIYFVISYKRGIKWFLKHVTVLLPSTPLIVFFGWKILFGMGYHISPSIHSYVFSALLLLWNSVHAFSLPTLIFFIFSLFYINKERKRSKILNSFFICFFLTILVYIPSLALMHYVVIQNFQIIFIFTPIILMIFISKLRNKNLVFVTLLIFMILKNFPAVYYLHYYSHPHELYAKFANKILEHGSTIIAGHELPFYNYYTNFTVYSNPKELKGSENKVYITSQYFKNENEVEFEELKNTTFYWLLKGGYNSYSSIVFENKDIDENKLEVVATYTDVEKIRPMEDTYECFYSIRGNILFKILTCYDFPRLEYKIYRLK